MCFSQSTEARAWADYWAQEFGIERELVYAVIEVESAWNPRAVSSKGAVGLMQLMPETAAEFGVRDRFDPADNVRGGVAYLAWLK
ncbi:MAG: lytic transglycosylase domain-containing protein, partial [bacterium]|nr:lytic transglycosylase domain-containing protein [bacterium]